jgi:hypothetical protein
MVLKQYYLNFSICSQYGDATLFVQWLVIFHRKVALSKNARVLCVGSRDATSVVRAAERFVSTRTGVLSGCTLDTIPTDGDIEWDYVFFEPNFTEDYPKLRVNLKPWRDHESTNLSGSLIRFIQYLNNMKWRNCVVRIMGNISYKSFRELHQFAKSYKCIALYYCCITIRPYFFLHFANVRSDEGKELLKQIWSFSNSWKIAFDSQAIRPKVNIDVVREVLSFHNCELLTDVATGIYEGNADKIMGVSHNLVFNDDDLPSGYRVADNNAFDDVGSTFSPSRAE